MRKTHVLELFKLIKKTIVSFGAIFVFVLFSVSIFLGLTWGGQAVKLSVSSDFKKYNMYDFEITCPYGISDDEIDQLKEIEGIDIVEPGYTSYQYFDIGEERKQAALNSITDELNNFSYLEGKLPQAATEILVEKVWAKDNNVKLGDKIVFRQDDSGYSHGLYQILNLDFEDFDNTDGMEYLNYSEFTITGLIESPTKVAASSLSLGFSADNTPVDVLVYAPIESFDDKAFCGYRKVYLKSNFANQYDYYSDEYKKEIKCLSEKIENVCKELSSNKMDKLYSNISLINTIYPGIINPNDFPELDNVVISRLQSFSVSYVDTASEASDNLKYCLSISLYAISLLICYSVLTRIIGEESVDIGTKKALGFKNKEITLYYLFYGIFAAILGAGLGILVARFIIEPITLVSIKGNFFFTANIYTMSIFEPIILSMISIVFIGLVTFLLCHKALKKGPVDLINRTDTTKAKNRFYEKFKCWKKLPLLFQTVVNNLFNDKKRVFSTIVSIFGVMSLMTCGLYFVNNVNNSGHRHFSQIQSFDYTIYYDASSISAKDGIKSLIEEESIVNCPCLVKNGYVELENGNSYAVTLYVPEENQLFDNVYHLKDNKNKLHSISEGVFVCNSLAEGQKLKIGDKFNFVDTAFGKTELEINQINQYSLLFPSIYMSKEVYENKFSDAYQTNAFLLNSEGKDLTKTFKKINNEPGFLIKENTMKNGLDTIQKQASALLTMSSIFLFMSVTMAMLVVMNILVNYINEKKKDLIILMINGYTIRKTKSYISADTVFLTFISILIGIGGGAGLGIVALKSISVGFMRFDTAFSWLAVGISAAVTIVLILITSSIALHRINKFQLTDINK